MQLLETATDRPATADECASLLMEAAPLAMRSIRAEMRGHRAADLSVPQFRALIYLAHHPGASLSALADHLGLTPPATSRLVDGLVARQAVERAASPADRRRIALTVTASGQAVLEVARCGTQARLAEHLGALSPDELSHLAAALTTLRRVFRPTPEAGPGTGATGD